MSSLDDLLNEAIRTMREYPGHNFRTAALKDPVFQEHWTRFAPREPDHVWRARWNADGSHSGVFHCHLHHHFAGSADLGGVL